jgi:hypothetical protein
VRLTFLLITNTSYHELFVSGSKLSGFLTAKDRKKRRNSSQRQIPAKITGYTGCRVEGNGCTGKTLFLDGLDEYRSRGEDRNLVLEVIKLLTRLKISHLRLSCRSADWLGDSDLFPFRRYFGDKPYVVLNLEPLSGEEISSILEEKNIEPSGFIEAATTHNLGNLLTNPQTLLMLIDAVGSGSWPVTKLELYEKSVEVLLSEHSSQQSQTKLGKYAPNELMAPAGALCASILLSGSAGISISNNPTLTTNS